MSSGTKWKGDILFGQEGHLVEALLEQVAGNPSSPVQGQIWYDSVANKFKFRSNSANVDPTDRAQHTGTQLSSSISDFDTQVRTSRLDQMAAPTANVSINSHKLTNLLDPTSDQDAATKAYVDAARAGLDTKDSVRVVTVAALPAYTRTGNIITASGNGALAAVDGVTLVLNDRLLLKDGAAGADNGIYYVSQVGDGSNPYKLTRTTDADSSAKITSGMYVFATEGTVKDNTGWVLQTNDPITLNTTSLSFGQFSGAGAITAGTGATQTGTTIDVIAGTTPGTAGPGGGLKANADDLVIDHDVVPLIKRFNVGDGAATTFDLSHSLGTRDVIVQVYLNSGTYETVIVHAERPDANTVRLIFPSAPTSNQYRCVVTG